MSGRNATGDPVEAQGKTMRIDWTRCEGRGLCIELLAARLDQDPWGYPLARGANRTLIPISPAELPDAVEAVKLCPRAALTLE
ncbi:ferredoxin [Psychromicrobium silvestre]|uniref:Ferredoxin n=1 Tax=Psychromicrobium silvestre TaxID=1645614 RepID=A0A7Y9S6T6_9MICC|nr:ferredoxin [Psychromicrobium silvestre]NYE95195.1 ferredoxin [Psychromicrobium silvestre]